MVTGPSAIKPMMRTTAAKPSIKPANGNSLPTRYPTTPGGARAAARLNNNVHVVDSSFWLVDFVDRSRAQSDQSTDLASCMLSVASAQSASVSCSAIPGGCQTNVMAAKAI